MTKVEEVARALCAESVTCRTTPYTPDSPNPALLGSPPLWKGYIPQARAAIAAMRGPTSAMSQAGWGAQCEDDCSDAIWHAMITSALAEKDPTT